MKNILWFLSALIISGLLVVACSAPSYAEDFTVYYNAKTNTKIGFADVLGNYYSIDEDVFLFSPGRKCLPCINVEFYTVIEDTTYELVKKPSVIKL